MTINIEFDYEPESDRWFASSDSIRGLAAYGKTKEEATKNIKILALHVLADFVEHDEIPEPDTINFNMVEIAVAA